AMSRFPPCHLVSVIVRAHTAIRTALGIRRNRRHVETEPLLERRALSPMVSNCSTHGLMAHNRRKARRAARGRPRLLMLDEPSAGASPLLVDRVPATAGRLREAGTAVLLVEQLIEKAPALADRV